MFLIIISGLLITHAITLIKKYRYYYRLFIVISFILTWSFIFKINFYLPMAKGPSRYSILILILSLIFSLLVVFYQKIVTFNWRSNILTGIAVTILLPICFIATDQISEYDYTYIFTPALKILNSYTLANIYFQYDLLPSLLATAWLKLGLTINNFQILAQLSFYLLITSIFLFTKRLFFYKANAFFLFIILIIIKIYGLMHDPIVIFQVTPWRLDLWLILLLLIYWKGIRHWLIGLALAILIIISKNFGIIYTICYFILITTDCIINLWPIQNILTDWRNYFNKLLIVIKQYLPNVIIIITGIIINSLLFGSVNIAAAAAYRRIGLGFMPIALDSFYWYLPIIFSVLAILLIKNREKLPNKYYIGGLFLIIFSIGNSIYFFGRSHENNIINIAAVLLTTFFLLIDLIYFTWSKSKYNPSSIRKTNLIFGIILITLLLLHYGQNILLKLDKQLVNIRKGQII
ncbi:MAG: hypothetical protein COX77_04575 [Candidatus Komeilibacteria bacterium CG_4_10_14_0_2_um_filter_37_10]|uniref:Glycosyltransferase RgtA/B/C/D-like domain-containing protein n=1 Tax=Candidatus Komeilibacteria bacterium CG_4_10_14_0_2_um_filter_37_10 TaxID=1974470 RepID=A0A2M7VDD4_9BACT|nr:MAG: hypothetical protein COX77_04575 [Candidatus Komeilibacteria bacterium CG_4_10_14_0_2_um_filter_37_10]